MKSTAKNSFPWQNAMGFGLGILQLAPKQFWSMTPRELDAAYRASNVFKGINIPIERSRFERLMEEFPDKELEK